MPRAGLGCLLFLVGVLTFGYVVAVFSSLPWWSLLFGVLFWVALLRRVRAGRSGEYVAPVEDDGRTPFPMFRNKGF